MSSFRSQLQELVTFLRSIRDAAAAANAPLATDDVDVEELTALLAPLPETVPGKFLRNFARLKFEWFCCKLWPY